MLEIFEKIADEFVQAAINDFHDPSFVQQLRREVDFYASRVLGVDLTNPIIRPFWDKYLNKGIENLVEIYAPYASLVVQGSPETVDATKDLVKDRLDDFAETLKKKIAEKRKLQDGEI